MERNRAKQIGLVDELGTLNDAVKFAAQKQD
jgi:ClpP class serine protease